jgi:diketogulonate reductase-like aldo/keto reductase
MENPLSIVETTFDGLKRNIQGKQIPYGTSPTFIETWKAMKSPLETGKVKAIG